MSKNTYQERFEKNLAIWKKDPLEYITSMWGLTPQPILPEYQQAAQILIEQNELSEFHQEWFAPFKRGVHLTWQQWLIIEAVKAAINNKASKRISIASAHGIGKSCTISLILLWYLFCHRNAQIAATAPTSKQLFDVLWKEASTWINRLHPFWKNFFDWQSTYIRHTHAPNEWFASAKTARKDSTEALAGVHGQHVMVIADEASGVPRQVFDTMEGSLTEKDILVLLISNPTRLTGYFFDTHNNQKVKQKWQTLQFDNISSPIVREDFNQDIIDKHGEDSDEYRIRVLGQFPRTDTFDEQGYTQLINKDKITEEEAPTLYLDNGFDNTFWIGKRILGVDPAGDGTDLATWVIRDQFKAAVIHKERTSTPITIARITRIIAEKNKVLPNDSYIDSFGIGAESAVELNKGGFEINPVNVGDSCEDEDDRTRYLNKRARNFTLLKNDINKGFRLVKDRSWKLQLPNIKERRTEKGKVQIMPKKEARKQGIISPNEADALMLTYEDDMVMTAPRTLLKDQRQSAYDIPQEGGSNQVITSSRHLSSEEDIFSAI